MDQKIAERWVAALRSGKYKQGFGRLRSKNRFCCLGVLCNLHAQAHPEIASKELRAGIYLHSAYYLPKAVRDWAETHSDRGLLPGQPSLAKLNDVGISFDEIAKVISKHWREL